jgi:hypothetical protein
MADSDYSSYILRYNLVSRVPEFWAGQDWYSQQLSTLTGSITINGTVTYSKAPVLHVSVLGTSGTITPDGTLGPTFETTLTDDVTLNGPSSPVDGQRVIFSITNDATHVVTLATGAGNFAFGTDITSYTGAPSKTDYIGAIYNATAVRWHVVAVIQGF